MTPSWKNKKEELINYLYEQNAQIMKDRDELLAEIITCKANKELYGYFLQNVENAIASFAEQAYEIKKAIEETDKELLAYSEIEKELTEDIKGFYKQVIDDK